MTSGCSGAVERVWAASGLALALALAACGGDDEPSEGSPDTDAAAGADVDGSAGAPDADAAVGADAAGDADGSGETDGGADTGPGGAPDVPQVGTEDFGFMAGWPPLAVYGQPYEHALMPRGVGQLELEAGPSWLRIEGDALVGTPGEGDRGATRVRVRLSGQGPDAGQVATGEGTVLVLPSEDADGDGLDNLTELALGTDPEDADSDRDGIPDGVEVGDPSAPTDSDGDGIIDALEGAFTDNTGSGTFDQEEATEGWQLTALRFSPQVVVNDGADFTTAEVRIVGGAVERAWLGRSQAVDSPVGSQSLHELLVDGVPVGTGRLELFDDGTHGDRIAGDGIWSRGGISATRPGLYVAGQLDTIELDEVTVRVGGQEESRRVWDGYQTGSTVLLSGLMMLGVIDPLAVGVPAPLGPDAQALPNALNVVAPVASTELATFLILGANPRMDLAAARVYEVLEDDYDFLYFLADRPTHGRAAGRQQSAQNPVQGIGRSLFDETASFGSAGRLLGVLGLGFATNGPMLHETLHQWAVFYASSFGFQGVHWGFSGADGQLGGFDPSTLQDQGDGTYTMKRFGTFANGGDGKPFSAWELYAMGVLPADEVPAIPVLESASFVSNTATQSTVKASGMKMVSVDDVIAQHGPRQPEAGAAPAAFRGAFVVLSQLPLTPAELSWVQARAALFGAPTGDGFLLSFEEATGGRATLDTSL